MLKSFADNDTEQLFSGQRPRKLPQDIWRRAGRKLLLVHASGNLQDLRSPPANLLEKLRGSRAGQWSIRINNQWRVCFSWHEGDAYEVEITDYHS